MNEVFLRIEKLRREKGATLKELANVCGISPQNVQRWKNGGTIMPEHLRLLAAFMNSSVDYLLSGISEVKESQPTYNSRAVDPNIPSSFETMKRYTDNSDALLQHEIESLREENGALRRRVDMLEESFKLIAKGINHAR